MEEFKTDLKHTDGFISSQVIQGSHLPVLSNERLASTLRFLATGESLQFLSFKFHISRFAVSYITKAVVTLLLKIPIFISLPSPPDEWHKIAAKFENRWNYSHALGSIDDEHVIMKKLAKYWSYYNYYKKKHIQSSYWWSLGQITNSYEQMLDVMVEIMMRGGMK